MKKNNISDFVEFKEDSLTKRVMIKDGKMTVFVLNFKPGQSLPAHKHPGSNVQLLVLEGNGEFNIDGETVVVEKNDTIFVGGDEELAFLNNGSKNVSLYVVLNNIPDDRYAKNI